MRRVALYVLAGTLVTAWAGGVRANGGPDRAVGPVEPVDPVEAAIVQAVRDRMGDDVRVAVEDLTVEGRTVLEPPLAAVPAPGARTGTPMRFQLVGIERGGAVRASRAPRTLGWAAAMVHVSVDHVRAKRLVARGQVLATDDLEEAHEPVTGVPLRWLPRMPEVQGARALVSLAPGTVLTKTAVAARPAVKSGQIVRATATVGSVQVVAELLAAQDGNLGSTVKVVNKSSRRELKARVIEPGVVRVIEE